MAESGNGRERILFVNETPGPLEHLRTSLLQTGCDWDLVSMGSPGDALEALTVERFDVLIVDAHLPGADAAEFLNQAKSLYPEIGRLVLLDRSDGATSVRFARVAHQCLVKPCSVETLKTTLKRIFALRRMLTGKSLTRLVSGLTNLPSLPASYQRLLDTVDSPSADTNEIAELIVRDLAMTAKILQLANSAFFGVPHRVADPAEAIQYLGVETLKALVLTAGIFTQFKGSRRTSLSVERLQQHSLDTGRAARVIAVQENLARPIADDAFAAGLLHDIGKLILITKDAEMYERALRIVRKDGLPLDRVEREVFGADHAEVGSYLLWLWALPETVTEAVAFHHQPAQCPAEGIAAVTLVHAADALVHESSLEPGAFAELDQAYLDSLGLARRVTEWREIVRGALPVEAR